MSALLWMTHVWNADLQAEFEKLYRIDGPGMPEVWLLLDAQTPGAAALAARYRCHVFDESALFGRGYARLPGQGLMTHCHFPVLDFFLAHPEHDHYWVVEYDVRYTGAWEALLSAFAPHPHDLITCHLRRFADEPRWYWWDSLHHPHLAIPRNEWWRSFNVIYRISNRALRFLHESFIDGWRGHSEVTLPTLLHHGGYALLDFGGNSPFALPGGKNRFYTSRSFGVGGFGTVRYRPARAAAGWRRNKLYHPVKPGALREPRALRLRALRNYARQLILGRP